MSDSVGCTLHSVRVGRVRAAGRGTGSDSRRRGGRGPRGRHLPRRRSRGGDRRHRVPHPARRVQQRLAHHRHHERDIRPRGPAQHGRHPADHDHRRGPTDRQLLFRLRHRRRPRGAVHLPARSRRAAHARARHREAVGPVGRARHDQLRRPHGDPEFRRRPLRDPEGRGVLHLRRGRNSRRGQRHHARAHRGLPAQPAGRRSPPGRARGRWGRRHLGDRRRHLVLQRLGELLEHEADDGQRPRLVALPDASAPHGPGRRRQDRQRAPGDRRTPVLRLHLRVHRLPVRLGTL